MQDTEEQHTTTKHEHAGDTIDMLIGGFGQQGGGDCLGIDWVRATVPANTPNHAPTDSSGNIAPTQSSLQHLKAIDIEHRGLLAELPSPTWLMLDNSVVYAPLEFSNEVVSLKVEEGTDGIHLTPISRVAVDGNTPTHLALSRDQYGQAHLIVACYGDGHVCVHPVDSDGHIGDCEQVLTNEGHGPLPAQECPHAHWILPLPDGRILTTDLGADQIHIHRWNGNRLDRVSSIECAPGTGPRDLHLLPANNPKIGWNVAVVDEWSSTVDIYAPEIPASGEDALSSGFSHVQRLGLDADAADQAASLAFVSDATLTSPSATSTTQESAMSTSGYCYVGLRGSDRIVTLRWDGEQLSYPVQSATSNTSSTRSFSSGGGRPRHIKAIANLLFVANQTTGRLNVFRLNANGEAVSETEIVVGSPTAIAPII
ncbi:lactonase family protein [Bifidobacterium sp.]|jgi:6-phosphogluconolactonase (cycloisomerase 2 family)|uniref:lactonase family protein n=1 Tax=Bifidobacterium sp. TaxID=41200 RepID=UPI0025C18431|nr:beta-propeller fold lactonase family protein [Bifidobacterium sp.]MCI1634962.1 lactonase family protein [Bifidobacterium sp.]